jgi:hypothetical protein
LGFTLRHPRRVLHNRRTMHESALAHRWLDGLHGVEIGGAAHNDFGLDTINVDRYPGTTRSSSARSGACAGARCRSTSWRRGTSCRSRTVRSTSCSPRT